MKLNYRWWGAAFVLCALAATFGVSTAANDIEVVVLNDGVPMEGMLVEVLASSGVVSGVTDSEGLAQLSIDGNGFRVRINGELMVDGAFILENSPVFVELTQ